MAGSGCARCQWQALCGLQNVGQPVFLLTEGFSEKVKLEGRKCSEVPFWAGKRMFFSRRLYVFSRQIVCFVQEERMFCRRKTALFAKKKAVFGPNPCRVARFSELFSFFEALERLKAATFSVKISLFC